MITEEQRARIRQDSAERARERGHVLVVTCPACEGDVEVPYGLSIGTRGFRLVNVDLQALPFAHVCLDGQVVAGDRGVGR